MTLVYDKQVPYSGKLLREKIFANFTVFDYSQKFSPRNLEVWCPLAQHERAIHGSFVRKNHFFYQFVKSFLPGKFLAIQYISLFWDDQWTSQRVRLYYLCVTVRNWNVWMRGWFLQAQSWTLLLLFQTMVAGGIFQAVLVIELQLKANSIHSSMNIVSQRN